MFTFTAATVLTKSKSTYPAANGISRELPFAVMCRFLCSTSVDQIY